ncbi:helix-turn-helix domain-containing protein [Streptomyces gamaensis]|uniref:Helix-turn-helix domain-containing protein n=1 Tax=Streptomyces gamaensis TaxID=1763542 RepID=A0ABW0YWR2_9ACTN
MPPAKELDPSASPQALYGAELRHLREAAGLSQADLGKRVICSGAFIGQLEAGTRRMPPDLAHRIDVALETNGFFERHCGAVRKSKHADYFAQAAELEPYAASICEFSPILVPGVLQTEAYARAVIRAHDPLQPESLAEKRLSARLERASILEGPAKPKFWAILHESVIRLPVGGRRPMAEQLNHIGTLAQRDRILIQVLPIATGAHPLMSCGLTSIMTFADAAPVVYTESEHTGRLLDDPSLVAMYTASYDLARAVALPPEASLALIRSVAEEHAHADTI